MRIIGGTARGTKLAPFDGLATRPTPDRVREAIFSMLFSRIGSLAGKRVADLFAGTGAMAIEALSRGAAHATLIEQDPRAVRMIEGNLKNCRVAERVTLITAALPGGLVQLSGAAPFDLVFLDPPYGQNLVSPVLEGLSRFKLLSPSALVVAETAPTDVLPDKILQLGAVDRRRYGSTTVHLFTVSNDDVEGS